MIYLIECLLFISENIYALTINLNLVLKFNPIFKHTPNPKDLYFKPYNTKP